MNMKFAFDHIVDRSTAGMGSNVPLSNGVLKQQNLDFRGTGGVSQDNSSHGFIPAFIDQITGEYYLSRFADGRIAPVHVLDGLPEYLVAERKENGAVAAAVDNVTAGFVFGGLFYTREQAAKAVTLNRFRI